MGGGPVEDEDDIEVSHGFAVSPQQPQAQVVVTNEVIRDAFNPSVTYASQVRADHATHERERPILSSMIGGGLVGGVVGSMLGMGSIMGSLGGAFVGASVASRDDALGANTRQNVLNACTTVETQVTKAVERINSDPIGRDLTTKVSSALQVLMETGEKYRIGQRVEEAVTKAVEVAEPKVRVVMGKVREADKHGYMDKANDILRQLDKTTGFSRSVDALSRELR